jgi:hypothetical protein
VVSGRTIGNPKLVPDPDPGSKISKIPPNVLAGVENEI